MPTLYIAGLALHLHGDGAADLPIDEAGPFLTPPPTPPDLICSVEIRALRRWPVPKFDELETKGPLDDSNQRDAIEISRDADFRFWREDVALTLSADGARGVAWVDGRRDEIWAVVQLALHALLLRTGGGVFHGSAGVIEGSAWLCPGPSGTGKSTIAREAGFDAVLADEMVALRPRPEGGFTAWGTPFWSKGRTLPLNPAGAPLSVVVRPVKAKAVSLEALPADEAAAWLLRCVTVYDESAASRAAAFALACEIAERTDAIRLEFPKEGPWLPAALKAYRQISSPRPTT